MPKFTHSVFFFALATTAATAQARPGAPQTIAGAQTSPVVKVHHERRYGTAGANAHKPSV